MAVRLTKYEGDGREEGEEFQIDIAMSGENKIALAIVHAILGFAQEFETSYFF